MKVVNIKEKKMRRKDREITDLKEIEEIIDKAKVLKLGLTDGDYPYIVPLHFGYSYCDACNGFFFYMHSAKDGKKLDLIRKNPNCFVELDTDMKIIEGDIACEYGSEYASFMGRGKAEIVDDTIEKQIALSSLMLNQTGKAFDINEKMAESVDVIKVEVTDFSAKRCRG